MKQERDSLESKSDSLQYRIIQIRTPKSNLTHLGPADNNYDNKNKQ